MPDDSRIVPYVDEHLALLLEIRDGQREVLAGQREILARLDAVEMRSANASLAQMPTPHDLVEVVADEIAAAIGSIAFTVAELWLRAEDDVELAAALASWSPATLGAALRDNIGHCGDYVIVRVARRRDGTQWSIERAS